MTMHQKVESLTKSEKKSLKNPKKSLKRHFFDMGPWYFFPRPPLLLVPTENPLDHGSG
jgi:hypothetical protein